MLQDILPHRFLNSFITDAKPSGNDHIIIFGKDAFDPKSKQIATILISNEINLGRIKFPRIADFMDSDVGNLDIIYLFSIDDEKYFYMRPDVYYSVAKDYGLDDYYFAEFSLIRRFGSNPQHLAFAAFTAYQLVRWYETTNYCGMCGTKNAMHETERARICPKCGLITYPRINPAVIIGITDPETNRIVITKYRTGFAHNALVAGFTEIGETLEETVKREAMEEVSLKVKNIRYYKSQPWGIASDILVGFFCDVDGDPAIKMDESELRYAEWISSEDLELQPTSYSLTNEMMKVFKEKGYEGTKGPK